MQVQHHKQAQEQLQIQNTLLEHDNHAKDQQIRDLHQAVRDLKAQKAQEIQTLTTQHVEENQRITKEKDEEIQQLKHHLDQTNNVKTNQAFKRPAAPTPQIPRWQQTDWK